MKKYIYLCITATSLLLVSCQPSFYRAQKYGGRQYVKVTPGEAPAVNQEKTLNTEAYTAPANINIPAATASLPVQKEKTRPEQVQLSSQKNYHKNETHKMLWRTGSEKINKDQTVVKKPLPAGPEKKGRILNTASFLTGLIATGVMIAAIVVLIVSAIVGGGSIAPIIMFSIAGILALGGLICGIIGVKIKGELIGLGFAGIIVTGLVLLISLIFFLTILL